MYNASVTFLVLLFAANAFAMPQAALPTPNVVNTTPPAIKGVVQSGAPYSPDFIHSVFPSTHKSGFMTVAGKELICHGIGTQGGQYACYAAAGQTSPVDCFFNRYINQTPVPQKCGVVPLPSNMTKPETSERTLSR